LLHYLNHGADYVRLLVGMEVPPSEKIGFKNFLDNLGYRYWDETNNPVYKLFLA
jgi:threonine dehydratase